MSLAPELTSAPAPTAPAPAAAGASVVLLPDARFFVRAVPVNAAAGAEAVSREVELALEVVSPFPVSQLFYGYLWHPESVHALVFAAFRRRFTDDEQAAWVEAERVVPHFVLAASLNPGPGRTVVLGDGASLTAVYWGEPGPVPSRVVTAPLAPDASDAERSAVRSALLRAVGSVGAGVVDLPTPVRTPDEGNEQRVLWAAGEYTLSLPLANGSHLDVRDKGELAARRASQRRARLLWRGFLAGLGALVLLTLGEVALIGLRAWEAGRLARVEAQQPAVDRIMSQQALATRIEELSTKQLRPFEMISLVTVAGNPGTQKPVSVQFIRTVTNGLYTLEVEAQTKVGGDLALYQAALRQNPAVASVEVAKHDVRDATTTFVLVITFKPEALAMPGRSS
ncbi:MAG: hypothetical protein ACK5CF_03705 [Opitutaceae bacterium]